MSMSKKETSLDVLIRFLPEGCFDLITPYFKQYTIHLTLTRERRSVLGDYRMPTRDVPYHRISINVTLNKYSFLITLLHELAHMLVFIRHGRKHAPHGPEWKAQFREELMPFLHAGFFPLDIARALTTYLKNPAASTCTDPALYKALYQYDERRDGYMLIDDLTNGDLFETEQGRIFEKMEQLRTRCRCREVSTNKIYLVPGIAEVRKISSSNRRFA